MTLCPSDTLQDWLRKRNTRLSEEADGAGNGVLFENNAHNASRHASRSAPRPTPTPSALPVAAATSERPPIEDAVNPNTNPLPAVLLPSDVDSGESIGGGGGSGDKDHKADDGTPVTSPRTDPVTSASSGTSDETSESSSSSSSASSAAGELDGCEEGTLCPPPTRETSRKCEGGRRIAMPEAFGTTPTEAARTPVSMGSPARSVGSETGSCEGRGSGGVGSRVDLHEGLSLFRQLAEGVSHIHSKGIIHRDIKVCAVWSAPFERGAM